MGVFYRSLVRPLVSGVRRIAFEPRPVPAGIGLALGGGFARGFAHIGVLEVLEEEGIPVSVIAGTSVGSVMGAAYASGVSPAQLGDICRRIRLRDLARWRISRMGLATNDRLGQMIRRWFRALRFEDLRVKLAVVASDLGSGEPVVFTRGELVDPIRASCAFPGMFEPVVIGGRCLADGGLVAQVPVMQAREAGARVVVGVAAGFNNWNGEHPANVFQVVSRAISVAQKHASTNWQAAADLALEPAVQHIDWDEFGRADEAIEAGRAAARQALPRLRELAGVRRSGARRAGAGDAVPQAT
jgi:NTE family protein